jgi:UDP-2,3-diacylglucosamine hydrolase
VWLASDIHLGENNPATTQTFFQFLDQASTQAGALLLLGDVFDVWIGDDWAVNPPPWLGDALDRLRAVAERRPLWLGRGNRDFLMGQALASRIGANLLPEQVIIDVNGTKALLAHGDEFCIDDVGYQRFRSIVHNPGVQRFFLSLPLSWRKRIAQGARLKSQQTQKKLSRDEVQASPEAMVQSLRNHRIKTIIHGHTHQPGHDHFEIDRYSFERWVLPDWESDHLAQGQPPRGGWIVLEEAGISLYALNGQRRDL